MTPLARNKKQFLWHLKKSDVFPNIMFAFKGILRISTEDLVREHPKWSIIYLCDFRDKYPNSSVVKWQENYWEENKS